MARRIDTYLRSLLPEEKLAFYEIVRDFSDAEIGANILQWEREHSLVPDDCLAKMAELGAVRAADPRGIRRPGG